MRECETGLGHGERASAGTNRRNHTPDGVWDEPRTRGLGASAEGVRRSGDEDCALRASRKREDAEQALGYMNRRALGRGRRSGLKEQEESWCGAVRLFDGAQARERYSLLAKDPLRGHKSPICEELHLENFMLKFLTWENAWGEFAYPLIRLRMAHISEISVHDFANSGKKLARAAPILMWGRGGSGRAARHRAYTWGMANNDQGYHPFEPGHSTPEFEQFARENQKYRKASHARGGAGGQKRMPSSGARSRSADAGGAGARVAGSRNANSRVASSRSGSPRAAASAGRGGSPSSGSAGRHASRGADKTLSQARAAGGRNTAGI